MHYGVRSANVVSYNAQFPTAIKEQQAICGMFDHVLHSNRYVAALALVLGIFHYRPAPFCLLDEVDAPLDENNVGRFCDIVRDMSRNVQFIFITHNKSTMELASQLVGVTMNEPGVSRLVAVDVDEAVRMAAM